MKTNNNFGCVIELSGLLRPSTVIYITIIVGHRDRSFNFTYDLYVAHKLIKLYLHSRSSHLGVNDP